MLERCECDSNTFKDIKNYIDTEFNTNKIVSGYYINGNQYDILLVENQNALYGDFKEFGFIAINADNYYIDFYWFYDQDYDMCVDDVTSFDEFYKENFSWIGAGQGTVGRTGIGSNRTGDGSVFCKLAV